MRFVVARTFKKNGSAAIAIDAVPSIFGYSEELEQRFGRKIEVLLLSGDSAEALEEAWPEYAPIAMTEDKESFERMIEEKVNRKK